MNIARAITVFILVVMTSLGRADSSSKIVEVSMPVLDYAKEMTAGRLVGRHHGLLVFTVTADRTVQSMIAGTVRSRSDEATPPFGEALVGALRRGETMGFTAAESEVFRVRLLKVLNAALEKNSVQFPMGGAVVLVRNEVPHGTDHESFYMRDRKWEETLKADFQTVMPSSSLVIIRLDIAQ